MRKMENFCEKMEKSWKNEKNGKFSIFLIISQDFSIFSRKFSIFLIFFQDFSIFSRNFPFFSYFPFFSFYSFPGEPWTDPGQNESATHIDARTSDGRFSRLLRKILGSQWVSKMALFLSANRGSGLLRFRGESRASRGGLAAMPKMGTTLPRLGSKTGNPDSDRGPAIFPGYEENHARPAGLQNGAISAS